MSDETEKSVEKKSLKENEDEQFNKNLLNYIKTDKLENMPHKWTLAEEKQIQSYIEKGIGYYYLYDNAYKNYEFKSALVSVPRLIALSTVTALTIIATFLTGQDNPHLDIVMILQIICMTLSTFATMLDGWEKMKKYSIKTQRFKDKAQMMQEYYQQLKLMILFPAEVRNHPLTVLLTAEKELHDKKEKEFKIPKHVENLYVSKFSGKMKLVDDIVDFADTKTSKAYRDEIMSNKISRAFVTAALEDYNLDILDDKSYDSDHVV